MSSPWGTQLKADRPLLDRIGAKNVNASLLWLYGLFWIWGAATLLLIPINANQPWPLALALAFGIVVPFIHALEIGIGATLVPGYEYYPEQPRWLYMIGDGIMLLCFIAILASYIVDPNSSSAPLFATFFLIISISILIFKLFRLVFPNGLLNRASSDGATAEVPRVPAMTFPGGEEYYDEYDYYEDEYEYEKSANPAARKLAAMLKAERMQRHGRGRGRANGRGRGRK